MDKYIDHEHPGLNGSILEALLKRNCSENLFVWGYIWFAMNHRTMALCQKQQVHTWGVVQWLLVLALIFVLSEAIILFGMLGNVWHKRSYGIRLEEGLIEICQMHIKIGVMPHKQWCSAVPELILVQCICPLLSQLWLIPLRYQIKVIFTTVRHLRLSGHLSTCHKGGV